MAPEDARARSEYSYACKLIKKKIKYSVKSKRDPKTIYSYVKIQYVKIKSSVKEHVRTLVNTDGETVTDRYLVAEALNSQFEPVFVVEPPVDEEELPYFEFRRVDLFIVELTEFLDVEAIEDRLSAL